MAIPLRYNQPVIFNIDFKAQFHPMNSGFIVEDSLPTGVTFNLSNSEVLANGEKLEGNLFLYDSATNKVTVSIPNVATNADVLIKIKLATYVSDTDAIVNNNYVIYNTANVKVNNDDKLITQSNVETVQFDNDEYKITVAQKVQVIPALVGEKIFLDATFIDSSDIRSRTFTVSNYTLPDYLESIIDESYVIAGTNRISGVTGSISDGRIEITFASSSRTRGQIIHLHLVTRIINPELIKIDPPLTNYFTLSVKYEQEQDAIVTSDSSTIYFLKPIEKVTKTLINY